MLDAMARVYIDPPLNRIGTGLAGLGLTANFITLVGLALGLCAAFLIAIDCPILALVPLLTSRLADGLDGAVARATKRTDFGGYLDITADFMFYGAIPVAFIILDAERNAIVGAILLLSFYVNGASFLGFAIMAEKRGLSTDTQGLKNLYYSGGLLEGTETIGFFVILCLWPASFPVAGSIFAALCFLTTIMRVTHARRILP